MVCRAGLLPALFGADCVSTMSEVVIYHAYNLHGQARSYKIASGLSLRFADLSVKLAKVLAILGVFFLLISYAPSVWFWVRSAGSETASQLIVQTAEKQSANSVVPVVNKNLEYQPPFDPTLTSEPRLKILSIGVDTVLQEATYDNYEEALKNGVWRVPDFGTPADRIKPTILAAHRFGYIYWSNLYRRQNSFYNLPKLVVGDTIEIDWRQRKYVYEIYGESKGEAISDYSADLILYTCEDLTGPVRIFKYARLMTI